MKERINKVRQHMEKAGLRQIVVTNPSSVYYLTGCYVNPHERMLALYLNEEEAFLFGNELFCLEQLLAGQDSGSDIQIATHKDSDNAIAGLARTIKAGQLGVDKSWAARYLLPLMETRKDVRCCLGSEPVDLARMQKDEKEISLMRQASQINDQVMELALAAIREDITESELAAYIMERYRQRGADFGSGAALVCFGENGADPHHEPVNRRLQRGDSVLLDIFTPISRYWCDMTRTVFYQEASEEQQQVYKAVKAANLAGIAAVKPGVPLRDIDGAARKVIEAAGYGPYFIHRLGHGCGIDCHEPPDCSAASEAVAQPGMIFSIEPGIYLPGRFGVRIEDLVLVTATGVEVLNKAPKELAVV